jgi:hypothetical protein
MSRPFKALDCNPVEYTRDEFNLIFEMFVPGQESDGRVLSLLTI